MWNTKSDKNRKYEIIIRRNIRKTIWGNLTCWDVTENVKYENRKRTGNMYERTMRRNMKGKWEEIRPAGTWLRMWTLSPACSAFKSSLVSHASKFPKNIYDKSKLNKQIDLKAQSGHFTKMFPVPQHTEIYFFFSFVPCLWWKPRHPIPGSEKSMKMKKL